MKLRSLAPVLTVLALGLGTTPAQPSYAQQTTTFKCGTGTSRSGTSRKIVPITYASTPRGDIPVISWVDNSYFPPPFTPKQRCEDVSKRFQRNYDNGNLKFLVIGTLNKEPVVCAAARNENLPCTDLTLLFTLKRGTDARQTVSRLMDLRGMSTGKHDNESGHYCKKAPCPPKNDDRVNMVDRVNMTDYLNKVPVSSNEPQPGDSTVEPSKPQRRDNNNE